MNHKTNFALAFLSLLTASAQATVITNGDFETPFFPSGNCFTGSVGGWASSSPISDTSCYIPISYVDPSLDWPQPNTGLQYLYLNNHGFAETIVSATCRSYGE